jgi:hypothetical protein
MKLFLLFKETIKAIRCVDCGSNIFGVFRGNAPKLSHSEGYDIYFGNKEVAVTVGAYSLIKTTTDR